ncbi:cytochrome c [Rhizobiales bacterium GAS191]|nr:cytochrome c [Rhizobiales bacterium GAS191]
MQRATLIAAATSSLVAAACAIAGLVLGSRPSLAAGDPAAGQQVFARCAVCHATAPGVNKVGPSLAGVVGRVSGNVAGYNYSSAMKNANITWDVGTLDKFLSGPAGFLHGTKMFLSVPNSADRQNVVAYLGTLKGP